MGLKGGLKVTLKEVLKKGLRSLSGCLSLEVQGQNLEWKALTLKHPFNKGLGPIWKLKKGH